MSEAAYRRLESWALGALQIYYTRPGLLDTLNAHDMDGLNLVKLTDLAALCERTDLLETMVRRWKQHLGEGKVRYFLLMQVQLAEPS
jgi:hypothetical protein